MIVQDLLSRFQARIREIVGTPDEMLFQPSEVLDDYANCARTDLFRIVKYLLIDSTTEDDGVDIPLPISVISVVAETSLYAMSPKILKTIRFQLASQSQPIYSVTQDRLDEYNANWRNSDPGTPQCYVTDYQTDSIYLWPPPSGYDTANLTNCMYPLLDLTADDLEADLGFKSEYHKDLLPKMLALAFSKQDSQCYRPELVPIYEAKFEKRADEIALEMYRRVKGSHSNRCKRAFISG